MNTISSISVSKSPSTLIIKLKDSLLNEEAMFIRSLIDETKCNDFNQVLIDTKSVQQINLGGFNELMHSHYVLKQNNKSLILVYKGNSKMSEWIKNTGIEKLVETAFVPE